MVVLPELFLVHAPHAHMARGELQDWSLTNNRKDVYSKIVAHMTEMWEKYKWFPPLPDDGWFDRIFTPMDAAQNGFARDVLFLMWASNPRPNVAQTE